MRVRKLTNTGDISFGNGQLDFWNDMPEGVGQTVRTRLLLWLGEWYLNTDDGTPYLESILGKYSEAQADSAIQDRVLDTDNVTGIENYVSSLDATTRAMTVSFDLNTVYGTTTVQLTYTSQF
jgi:hypothetical protein